MQNNAMYLVPYKVSYKVQFNSYQPEKECYWSVQEVCAQTGMTVTTLTVLSSAVIFTYYEAVKQHL